MARQHGYKAIGYRWRFPPKLVELPDGSVMDATPAPGRTYTRATWPPRGRGRGESLTSPRRIEAKLRAIEVIKLRRAGLTFAQIARRLGYRDRSGPYRAIRRLSDWVDWKRQRRDG